MKKILVFVLFSIVALEPVLAVGGGGCGGGGCGGGGGGAGVMLNPNGPDNDRPMTPKETAVMAGVFGGLALTSLLPTKVFLASVFAVTGGLAAVLAGTVVALAFGFGNAPRRPAK